MPRAHKYREILRKLALHDKRFVLQVEKGKGSHRVVFHPDINGQNASFPVPYHGDNKEMGKGMLKAMIRRFNLPADFFD